MVDRVIEYFEMLLSILLNVLDFLGPDWSMFLITGFGTIASLIVAIAAVWSSRNAVLIAERAEAARQLEYAYAASARLRETDRLATERKRERERAAQHEAELAKERYNFRLEENLAVLLRSFRAYLTNLVAWHEKHHVDNFADEDSMHMRVLFEPDGPSYKGLSEELEIVLMIARGEDAELLDTLRDSFAKISLLSVSTRIIALEQTLMLLRKWRRGEETPERIMEFLKRFHQPSHRAIEKVVYFDSYEEFKVQP